MSSDYKKFLSDELFLILKELLESFGYGGKHSLSLSSAVGEGENCGGIVIDAHVEWLENRNTPTSHFTIKVIPPSKILKTMVPIEASYEREINMYSKVFPKFLVFENERNVIQNLKFYPAFYKTITETQEMLVFENLRQLGFKHRDRRQPLDYNHLIIIIREYARLHALSIAIRDQNPTLFEELKNLTYDHYFKDYRSEGVRLVTEHRVKNALKSLDPVHDAFVYKKFLHYHENMFSINRRLMTQTNPYAVISHLDTGISNFLFKYENESNNPTELAILDWQMAQLASPAIDLSSFIFSASDKTLRKCYNDIILEYYKTLSSFIKQLGSDPEKLLPFQVLQDQLKTYSVFGLYVAVQFIYLYTTTSKVPDILNDESHTERFSFLYELEDRSMFDERVRDVIIDFDRLGYNFS